MSVDDQIEQALAELPVWAPPSGFVNRVVSRIPPPPVGEWRPTPLFWAWTTAQAAAIAGVAYLASGVISRAAAAIVVSAGPAVGAYVRSLGVG
jgi:hypothetical protein